MQTSDDELSPDNPNTKEEFFRRLELTLRRLDGEDISENCAVSLDEAAVNTALSALRLNTDIDQQNKSRTRVLMGPPTSLPVKSRESFRPMTRNQDHTNKQMIPKPKPRTSKVNNQKTGNQYNNPQVGTSNGAILNQSTELFKLRCRKIMEDLDDFEGKSKYNPEIILTDYSYEKDKLPKLSTTITKADTVDDELNQSLPLPPIRERPELTLTSSGSDLAIHTTKAMPILQLIPIGVVMSKIPESSLLGSKFSLQKMPTLIPRQSTFIQPERPFPPTGPLVLTRIDKVQCKLTWHPPKKVAESAILQYLVECKIVSKGNHWFRIGKTFYENITTECRLRNIDYIFRVKTVSSTMSSKWLYMEKPPKTFNLKSNVNAIQKPLKPFIVRNDHKNISVRKGENVEIHVEFGGEPQPQVTWYKFGDEIYAMGRISIRTTQKLSELFIKDTIKQDSGEFKLLLENEFGKTSAIYYVKVFDKPSPPIGDLIIKNVSYGIIQLNWQHSADSGDCELLSYIIENMEIGTNEWTLLKQVPSTETCAICAGIDPSKQYVFRIIATNQEGYSQPLIGSLHPTTTNPHATPSQPGRPLIVSEYGSMVELKWSPPEFDGGYKIFRYIIEMKNSKDSVWEEISQTLDDKPEIFLVDIKKRELKQFRILAVNANGASVPSKETRKRDDFTESSRPIIDKSNLENHTFKTGQFFNLMVNVSGRPAPFIHWYFQNTDSRIRNTKQINVKNFTNRSELTISPISQNKAGKYIIEATNSHGSDRAEFFLNLTDQLNKPVGPLRAVNVPGKGCLLRWEQPTDQSNSPIKYKVNKMDNVYSRKTACGHTNETEMIVSGLEQGKSYYFSVSAVYEHGESENLTSREPIIADYHTTEESLSCIPNLETPSLSFPPKILNEINEFKLMVGQELKIVIDYISQPEPNVSWYFKRFKLYPDNQLSIINSNNRTILIIKEIQLINAGNYKVKLTNIDGTHEKVIQVIVLSPETSLQFSEQELVQSTSSLNLNNEGRTESCTISTIEKTNNKGNEFISPYERLRARKNKSVRNTRIKIKNQNLRTVIKLNLLRKENHNLTKKIVELLSQLNYLTKLYLSSRSEKDK